MAEATGGRTVALELIEEQAARRRRVLMWIGLTLTYTLLVFIAVLTVFPFLWMLSTSFKIPGKELTWPPQWIPSPVTFENYEVLFSWGDTFPFARFIWNSAYIAAVVVAGRLVVCAMAGYAFARIRFKGSKIAFTLLIGSLLMPTVVRIIPLYQAFYWIGWLDTHLVLIVPPIVSNTFGTFLFRQFFMTLPNELEDAARIDGANHFLLFWRIALPLSKPVIAALAIFTFQGTWNDFQTPYIFMSTMKKYTLPVGLQAFSQEFTTDYGMLMAASMIALAPILVVYTFLQRYFVAGIQLTGLKG